MLCRTSLSLLLLAFVSDVWAATRIDEVRPAQPGLQLRVENISGSITLIPGRDDQVLIRGQLGDGSRPLLIEGDATRLAIEVKPEQEGSWGGRMGPTSLEITVPVSTRIDVNTVSADVDVRGINGSEARIETVSGAIAYRGASERVRLKSVSGAIQGEGEGRHWTVGSVSGRIHLPAASGEVDVETVSGTLELNVRAAQRLRAETVSGRIIASGALADGGEIDMQSVSGAVELTLSGNVDARIQAKTFSGKVESDFGTVQRSGFGGGSTLDARAGTGAGMVRVESFSGKVTIRQAGR